MTSRALFIMVAESMVILAPMFQLGWRRAWAGVTWANRSASQDRKGPPEAVSHSFFTSSRRCPWRACMSALCSLSTGIRSTARALGTGQNLRIFPARQQLPEAGRGLPVLHRDPGRAELPDLLGQ